GWSAFDEARKVYYGRHPLGNSVLGTVASITALTRDQMHDYFRRRYVAPNVHAVAAGNFDWGQFVECVGRSCGGWESGPVGRSNLRPAAGESGVHTVLKEKVAQEHVVLASAAPPADSPLRFAADTLAVPGRRLPRRRPALAP